MKILSEAQIGVDFGHFRGASGKKIKNLFEKNVKAFLPIKINYIKVVLKSHIYIIQL